MIETAYDPATETLEQLRIGNLSFLQPKHGYRFSVDAVLLADFLSVKPDERLIDLGTGAGILPLLASALTPAREIVGIEIQERLANLAKRNVALNHLQERITVVQGDIRQIARYVRSGEFDALCANPPYRKVGAGRMNPNAEQAIARHELSCTLNEFAAACKYIVKPGGKVFVIYLPERLSELIEHLNRHNIEPKKLRCVHSTATTDASLILIEAHRDASPGVKILPPLFLYHREGSYTEEAKRILREEEWNADDADHADHHRL